MARKTKEELLQENAKLQAKVKKLNTMILNYQEHRRQWLRGK